MEGKLVYVIIASTPKELKKGKETETKLVKSAPSYLDILPKVRILDQKTIKINNYDIKLLVKSFFPENVLIEANVDMKDILSKEIFELKDKLFETCNKMLEYYKPADFIEEYSVFCVKNYTNLDETINKNKSVISSILKDEKLVLDEDEIKDTLSVNMSYGKNDSTIVDWDGAIIFDKTGEFDEAISILELSNVQLLGLRILDKTLATELERLKDLGLESKNLLQFRRIKAVFKDIIKLRTESILDLEEIEGRIKLYGDWYSGKLYELVSKKLYIDRWKQSVNNKLVILQQIYEIVDKTISDFYLLILEATIVVLILIEIVMGFAGLF